MRAPLPSDIRSSTGCRAGGTEEAESPTIAKGLLAGINAAITAGKLPPLIFVIVNGGRFTRYYDSLDRTVMMETTLIRELIPHIDATYRTVATRGGRAVQGGSMGGMGTLKFAFKYSFSPSALRVDTKRIRQKPWRGRGGGCWFSVATCSKAPTDAA